MRRPEEVRMDRFEKQADQSARSESVRDADDAAGASSQRTLDRLARLETNLGVLGEWAIKMHAWANAVNSRVDGLPDPPKLEREITDQGGRPSHIPR